MSCEKCDTCVLIDNKCLSTYSTLRNIPLSTIQSTVISANLDLHLCIGDCFEKLCSEGVNEMKTTVLASPIFKAYYAVAIQYDWECDYGSGQAKKQGHSYAQGDDFQDFRIASQKEIAYKSAKTKEKLKSRRKQFLQWFKDNFSECFESKDKTCGCNNNCRCGKKPNNTNIDNCIAL